MGQNQQTGSSATTGEPVEFRYAVDFRLRHLWLAYGAAAASVVWMIVMYVQSPGPRPIMTIVGILLLLLAVDRAVMRYIPLAFRIDGTRVTLIRLRSYAEFDVSDVEMAIPNARWILKGWTKVILRGAHPIRCFYVAPDAEWREDLITRLTDHIPPGRRAPSAQRAKGDRTYSWTPERVWFMRILCAGVALGLVCVPADCIPKVMHTHDTSQLVILIPFMFLMLVNLWQFGFRMPVHVDFRGDWINFEMLFGTGVSASKADVDDVVKGRKIGPLRLPVGGSTSVILKGKVNLFINSFFIEYPELSSRLHSLARGGDRPRA